MLSKIAKPFGILLLWLYNLVNNYGVAIFLFAVVVKLIFLPFQMKSKKSMMRMTRLTPRVKELEKQHAGNQRKYQEEVSKLYKEEKVNPTSGCLWTLLPFPILIALYEAIRYPLSIMMGVPKELITEGGAIAAKLADLGFESNLSAAYLELAQSRFISDHFSAFSGLSDKLVEINYKFIGLDLGSVPQWNFFAKCNWSDVSDWLPALGLFLIPIVSATLSWLQMKVAQAGQNSQAETKTEAQMQNQMKSMNLMMPLMSLYICFIMPAALGMYWIYNSVLAMIQEFILNKHYKKIMDQEDAERLERDKLRAAELERKRQETERLKAEGATTVNANTSKKKLQAKQKAEMDELKAAAIREEKAKRREMLGIQEEEKPASQVGNRRYARGRAYVPDRFTNPEHAAEATEAAAAESEFGASIDESLDSEAVTAETAEETAEEVIDAAGEESAEETEEAEEEVEEENEEADDEDDDEDEE